MSRPGWIRRDRAGRGGPSLATLALLVYVLQIAVLAPIHRSEATPAPAPQDDAISWGGAPETSPPPCENSDHRHRPLPRHSDSHCALCSVSSHGPLISVGDLPSDEAVEEFVAAEAVPDPCGASREAHPQRGPPVLSV